ncbi:GNAT family N-acetyltransferase [Aestuariivivens insulae]|uniref:GNAT family N-acetyltransferase n=1 Tax=Aestuariivivens insulae TaxID=1621988 RepID=UPI001F561B7A|nr:GNAT family N-acetyltransferase [Aestuariivivens insulae]
MEFLQMLTIPEPFKIDIFNLWNQEYPQQLSYETLSDFNNYLKKLTKASHILIIKDGKVFGWYVDFIRDNKRWFVILLNSNTQGKGYGTQLLNLAKQKKMELNGWVIDHNNDLKYNGEHYLSPLGFYLKNGFEIISKDRLELKTISAVRIRWQQPN